MRQLTYPDLSCIILIGGKSLRLGRDKALEQLGANNLTERVLQTVSSFKTEIILVENSKVSHRQFNNFPKLRYTTDVYPGKGPLGGVYTGLIDSNTSYNLVVACDMPLLNVGLLHYMVEQAPGFDMVIPRTGNYVEPLHAVYSKRCLGAMKKLIERNVLQINRLLPSLNIRYIEPEEIDRFDSRHLSFININTEADLKKAKELLEK